MAYTTILRAAPLVLGVLVAAACHGNRSEDPPVHIVHNMDFQERGDPQERNDFFPDHRWMREPPAGTVAVGFLKADDHLYRGKNLDGTFANGLPATMELNEGLLARGQQRYNIYCAPCHGEQGRGDGVATRRGGGLAVQPANFHQKKFGPAPLGYFFHVITNGKGQMLPYAAQVTPEDRWAIAAWVRVLQLSHQASQADVVGKQGGNQ